MSSSRFLHRSHLAKKLQQQDIRRYKHLDDIPNAAAAAAAASAEAAAKGHPLRIEKEDFARELLQQQCAIASLFSEDQKAALFGEAAAAAAAAAADAAEDAGAAAADAATGEAAAAAATAAKTERKKLSPAQQQQLDRHLRKAMRAWRLLRPEAEPFYKVQTLNPKP